MNYKVPLTIGALVFCAGLMATVIPTMSGAQNKGIEITAPLPLPVTGTVNVGNFPNTFNIRQAPGATPLVTRAVDIEPFRTLDTLEIPGGDTLCHGRVVAQAPVGRRAIIEHVSALFTVEIGQKITVATLQLNTNTPPWRVVDVMAPTSLGALTPELGSPYVFAISHDTKVYLNSGEFVQFVWCRNKGGSSATAEVAVSGFVQ
jgi:hypothetical protein